MKKLILTICLLFSVVSCAYAAIPHLINYQGRLTDKDNAPLNGSYNLTLRIYDAETAGSLLWEETHTGVVIQKGIFSILLGSITDLTLAFDKPYFLEIKVGNEIMTPRQRIGSAGYALRAEKAEEANNAATVSNIGASATPQPNKILPLDANAKLPVAALKVYDSGWFPVSTYNGYTKAHNLGTTKVLWNIFTSKNNDGSNAYCVMYHDDSSVTTSGPVIKIIDSNNIRIHFAGELYIDRESGYERPGSGYARIIGLALE